MNVNIPAPPTLKTLTLFWAVGKNHRDLEQSRGTLDLAARHFFTCPPEGVQVFGCSSPVFLFSREESFLSMRKPLPEMELFFSSHFQPARRANGRPSCIVHRLIRGDPDGHGWCMPQSGGALQEDIRTCRLWTTAFVFLRWIGGWIRSQLHLLALQNIYGSIPEAADFTALEDDANGSKLQMGWKTSTKLQMYEHTQPEIRYWKTTTTPRVYKHKLT